MIELKKIISLILVIATCLSVLVSCDPAGQGSQTEAGDNTPIVSTGLILNELVASNKTTLMDNYGEYSDWIELYNNTDAEINLKNYMISDDPTKPEKYIFPSVTIPSKGYFIIWASGRGEFDEAKSVIHLPFGVSKVKEEICLFEPSGKEIGRITVEDLPEDISAAPDGKGGTVMLATPTPGTENVKELYVPSNIPDRPINSDGPDINTVRINEYCTSECITFTDSDGDFGAWVELYNVGDKDISLGGLYLSDNENNKMKWAFPEITLGAGKYITVFMNGKEAEYKEGEDIHASFTLSGDETVLAIYNGAGVEIDKTSVQPLIGNLTYGRDDVEFDKWQFYPKATPNAANTLQGFESIESARYPSNKTLYVNEAVAVNATLSSSPDGKTYPIGQLYDYYTLYDYIEIHNPTDNEVSLSDFYISDGKDYKKRGELPDVTIEPGEYRVIYLDDETYYSSKTKKLYLGMGLNRYGETVYIFDKDGVCIDSMKTGRLYDGCSSGRDSETDDTVYYYQNTTPGETNDSTKLGAAIASPTFDRNGGYVGTTGTQVTIIPPKNSVVFYTTDGSVPTTRSQLYNNKPIEVNETVTIRAMAYREGYLPSEDVAISFIVGRQHDIPVVCITSDEENLFGEDYGIFAYGKLYQPTAFPFKSKYTNFWQDWERPIHFDYIDENGEQVLSFNAGAKIFGQFSRACVQKSFTVNLRDKYGPTEVCYPFFENNINVFSSLVLRNGGQDSRAAHIRDAFVAKAVIGEIDVDVMDYQPVAVYMNGEYYGLYDLRERVNADYIANHTGADPDKVDLIKGNNNVLDGSIDEYKELEAFLENNSLKNEENYKKACEMVDVDELIDYWLCVIFFSNTDSGNIKFYKERTEGAKWRWILYDLDWGMSPSTYDWNMFDEVLNPNGHGVGNSFSTLVMCSFLKNPGFKDKFIKRCAELLNTSFSEERLLKIYDELIEEIKNEMPYYIERWDKEVFDDTSSAPGSMKSWEKNVSRLREIITEKRQIVTDDLAEHFDLSKSDLKELGLAE